MSSIPLKMSSLFPKIPPELARALPLDALSGLLGLEPGLNKLEAALGLTRGTLAKTQRGYPGRKQTEIPRGLSAKVHQAILEKIAKQFTTGDQMRAWMKKHWPRELLEQNQESHETIYEAITRLNRLPHTGVFPADYIKRDEHDQVLDLLIYNKDVQIIWLTGPGGSGKTTLLVGLVRQAWALLKQHFADVFWVDAEQADYQTGLQQLARQLDLSGQSTALVEQKLKALTRTHKTLIILDALHDVKDWEQWKNLAGYLGRLVVTSRVRLPASQISADSGLRQIAFDGLSKTQVRQFLKGSAEEIDQIFKRTEGLPLALRLLKGLMQDLHIPARQIAEELSAYPLDILTTPAEEQKRDTSLRACFGLTWNILREKAPEAARCFASAGAFHSHSIPSEVLERVAAPGQALDNRKALSILQRYSLGALQIQQGMAFLRVHALVHEFAREKLESSLDAEQIQGHYQEQMQASIQEWAQTFEKTGRLHLAAQLLEPDVEYAARSLSTHASPENILSTGKNLYNLLAAAGKQHLLDNWLAMLEAQTASAISKAWARNLRGWIALEQVDLPRALHNFQRAYQVLGGDSVLVGEYPPEYEQQILFEKANSLLGMAHYALAVGKPEESARLLRSPAMLILSSLASSEILKLEIDLLRTEIHIEAMELEQAQEYLVFLRPNSLARNHLVFKLKIAHLQAEYFRQQNNHRRAARLYECLFHHPNSAPVIRCESGLGWAACLGEMQQYEQAEAALREIETALIDEPKYLARFWKYKALAHFFQKQYSQALPAASTALQFWQKIPDSQKEQQDIQRLVAELHSKMET